MLVLGIKAIVSAMMRRDDRLIRVAKLHEHVLISFSRIT
jgi:hypothetical protein